MRKTALCICETKDADQLRGNREADQHLCFRYTDSTIPLLSKSEISSLKASSVAVQPGLCQTWSETLKTGFLTTRLIRFPTVSSNEEVYDKMRKQRMLREELRDKKKQLESIMKKDRNKKQYIKNQDNQSDTGTYNTDAFG